MMIEKLICFFRQLIIAIRRKKITCINDEKDVNIEEEIEAELNNETERDFIEVESSGKTTEVRRCEAVVILTNGVAISESFICDGTLNATDRSYLLIIIYKFNLAMGYAEVSISDFLAYTHTTNRTNVIKVIERLEKKEVIEKIKGGANDSNRFLVLKHMLIIGGSRIKYDTSNINDTSGKSIDEEIEYKDIIFKEVSEDEKLSTKYAALMIKDTCYKNIRELNGISENYTKLESIANELMKKQNG
ncbi:Uncharacterised protein [Clostridium disporicum]|uniref:Uncharacterized protein n=2 Tax=Clostridium disporicum TaxID=84024 RepID=A0A174JM69_9CLOT|nr:Uncharacterised protein [Clostridium disporicum]